MAVMKITEAEAVVRSELGEGYLPVRLGGYWLIHHRDGDVRALVAQNRSLPRAIEQARAAS